MTLRSTPCKTSNLKIPHFLRNCCRAVHAASQVGVADTGSLYTDVVMRLCPSSIHLQTQTQLLPSYCCADRSAWCYGTYIRSSGARQSLQGPQVCALRSLLCNSLVVGVEVLRKESAIAAVCLLVAFKSEEHILLYCTLLTYVHMILCI